MISISSSDAWSFLSKILVKTYLKQKYVFLMYLFMLSSFACVWVLAFVHILIDSPRPSIIHIHSVWCTPFIRLLNVDVDWEFNHSSFSDSSISQETTTHFSIKRCSCCHDTIKSGHCSTDALNDGGWGSYRIMTWLHHQEIFNNYCKLFYCSEPLSLVLCDWS